MMTETRYRTWCEDDIPFIRDVLWRTWLSSLGRFIPEDDLASYFAEHYNPQALFARLCDPQVGCMVAEVGPTIAAVEITRLAREEQRFYVSSLYVLPEFQSLGLGRGLMKLAAANARQYGLDRVWLGVMVKNDQAVEWYRRLGLQIVEELPFRMGTTVVNHYIGYVLTDALLIGDNQYTTQADEQ
jgi:ribosomal protein S18 acetylase RimI-like enzyme